ncbi:MAG TPA: prepilin-type N-terminal cleavage/methylation domain-containing protein [Candidatus Paceibacterota bacterium]
MYKTQQRGFTLIELLVVIAIIGLLSSVVLASLNGARAKGRDARRLSDLKQIQVALELFASNDSMGKYPSTLAALTSGGYIPVIPLDPSTGLSFVYDVNTSSTGGYYYYCLGAVLETPAPVPADVCSASKLGKNPTTGPTYRVAP